MLSKNVLFETFGSYCKAFSGGNLGAGGAIAPNFV